MSWVAITFTSYINRFILYLFYSYWQLYTICSVMCNMWSTDLLPLNFTNSLSLSIFIIISVIICVGYKLLWPMQTQLQGDTQKGVFKKDWYLSFKLLQIKTLVRQLGGTTDPHFWGTSGHTLSVFILLFIILLFHLYFILLNVSTKVLPPNLIIYNPWCHVLYENKSYTTYLISLDGCMLMIYLSFCPKGCCYAKRVLQCNHIPFSGFAI